MKNLDSAIVSVTAFKSELDESLKDIISKDPKAEVDILLQIQASCIEFLQCAEAIKKGYNSWGEVPLSINSI